MSALATLYAGGYVTGLSRPRRLALIAIVSVMKVAATWRTIVLIIVVTCIYAALAWEVLKERCRSGRRDLMS